MPVIFFSGFLLRTPRWISTLSEYVIFRLARKRSGHRYRLVVGLSYSVQVSFEFSENKTKRKRVRGF